MPGDGENHHAGGFHLLLGWLPGGVGAASAPQSLDRNRVVHPCKFRESPSLSSLARRGQGCAGGGVTRSVQGRLGNLTVDGALGGGGGHRGFRGVAPSLHAEEVGPVSREGWGVASALSTRRRRVSG